MKVGCFEATDELLFPPDVLERGVGVMEEHKILVEQTLLH